MATIRQNRTDDAQQDRVSLETVSDVKALLGAPFLKGRSVMFAATGAGNVNVPHGLGKKPSGWFVTDVDAAASLSRSSWDDRRIVFTATGAANFTLWVW